MIVMEYIRKGTHSCIFLLQTTLLCFLQTMAQHSFDDFDDAWDSQFDFEDDEEIIAGESKEEPTLVPFETDDYDAGELAPCTNEDAVSYISSMGFRTKGVRVGQWKQAPGKPYVFMVARKTSAARMIGPQHAALEFSSYMKIPYCFQYIYAAHRSPGKILNR